MQLPLRADMLCTAWTATGVLFLRNDLALPVAVTWLLATHWPCWRPILGLLLGFIQIPSNSLVLAAPGMVLSALLCFPSAALQVFSHAWV